MKDFLKTINFTQLRDDKEKLISLSIGNPKLDLDGIINLIDTIQDLAVEKYGYSEEQVFNFDI